MSKETMLINKGAPSESRVSGGDGAVAEVAEGGSSFREGWALGGGDI